MTDMSPVSVRPATPGDIEAIAAIYAHAVTHGTASFEYDPPSVTEMAARQKALLDGGFPYLVAIADGEVAGYAYAGPYRPRLAYRHTVEDSVYIGERFHRRGIGRLLLMALIAKAEERGFRQMIAVIGDSGQAPSIALHRSLDFTMVGTLSHVGFKHGQWLDTVLMQRPLGPGAETPP